jgi:hypothetical protein
MVLEVRDNNWTEDSIKNYIDYLKCMMSLSRDYQQHMKEKE